MFNRGNYGNRAKLCKWFAVGRCSFGANCSWSHAAAEQDARKAEAKPCLPVPEETAAANLCNQHESLCQDSDLPGLGEFPRADKVKTKLCTFWQPERELYCLAGDQCRFAHGVHELRNDAGHPLPTAPLGFPGRRDGQRDRHGYSAAYPGRTLATFPPSVTKHPASNHCGSPASASGSPLCSVDSGKLQLTVPLAVFGKQQGANPNSDTSHTSSLSTNWSERSGSGSPVCSLGWVSSSTGSSRHFIMDGGLGGAPVRAHPPPVPRDMLVPYYYATSGQQKPVKPPAYEDESVPAEYTNSCHKMANLPPAYDCDPSLYLRYTHTHTQQQVEYIFPQTFLWSNLGLPHSSR